MSSQPKDPKTTITQLETVGRIYAAVSPFCHDTRGARTLLTLSLLGRAASAHPVVVRPSCGDGDGDGGGRSLKAARTWPPACVYPPALCFSSHFGCCVLSVHSMYLQPDGSVIVAHSLFPCPDVPCTYALVPLIHVVLHSISLCNDTERPSTP